MTNDLNRLCRQMTVLTDAEIGHLEEIARQLPLMAELTGADVFIDCVTTDGKAVVAAHGRPFSAGSAYEKAVVGQYALPEREPAVFRALELRSPVRDLKAITQENRAVRQDVVPILGEGGSCIALLIRETDISGDLLQEKKFRSLAKTYEAEDRSIRAHREDSGESIALREVHHRVKNSLQMVASILNLQARRCGDANTGRILRENVNRVLSIAAIHDILTSNQKAPGGIDSLALLEQLRKNLQAFAPEDKDIFIRIEGDNAVMGSDTAGAAALVINELVTNALEHAFSARDRGEIVVSFSSGSLFHTVTVADNGSGFDPDSPRPGKLGLNIAAATVRDRLHGHLVIQSGPDGTRASFDMKTE